MKELVFSITLNNYTFNIRTNPQTTMEKTIGHFSIAGKYTTFLTFASNTYAQIRYKNVMFSSTVTKRNKWSIRLDYQPVVNKHYGGYFFKTTHNQDAQSSEVIVQNPKDYPENIFHLFEQLINELPDRYSCIENKELFKNQVCDYLYESYFDVKDLDEVNEYENYANVDLDEDPIIETKLVRDMITNDCKNFFISFRQAELDNKNQDFVITLKNIIKEVPKLCQIPCQCLENKFKVYLDENYDNLIEPDIYYRLSDVLRGIGNHLYKSYQYYVFIDSMEEKIDKILATTNIDDASKNEIYCFFKSLYDTDNIPSDDAFEKSVAEFAENYMKFFKTYDKFTSLFNNDHIEINWDDKIIQLFQNYDKEKLPVDSKHLAEYEVYQYIIPYYRKYFFRKNTTKYKPVIEQLPAFISYGSTILDILFKNKLLIDSKDQISYNEYGDVDSAYKEMEELLLK